MSLKKKRTFTIDEQLLEEVLERLETVAQVAEEIITEKVAHGLLIDRQNMRTVGKVFEDLVSIFPGCLEEMTGSPFLSVALMIAGRSDLEDILFGDLFQNDLQSTKSSLHPEFLEWIKRHKKEVTPILETPNQEGTQILGQAIFSTFPQEKGKSYSLRGGKTSTPFQGIIDMINLNAELYGDELQYPAPGAEKGFPHIRYQVSDILAKVQGSEEDYNNLKKEIKETLNLPKEDQIPVQTSMCSQWNFMACPSGSVQNNMPLPKHNFWAFTQEEIETHRNDESSASSNLDSTINEVFLFYPGHTLPSSRGRIEFWDSFVAADMHHPKEAPFSLHDDYQNFQFDMLFCKVILKNPKESTLTLAPTPKRVVQKEAENLSGGISTITHAKEECSIENPNCYRMYKTPIPFRSFSVEDAKFVLPVYQIKYHRMLRTDDDLPIRNLPEKFQAKGKAHELYQLKDVLRTNKNMKGVENTAESLFLNVRKQLKDEKNRVEDLNKKSTRKLKLLTSLENELMHLSYDEKYENSLLMQNLTNLYKWQKGGFKEKDKPEFQESLNDNESNEQQQNDDGQSLTEVNFDVTTELSEDDDPTPQVSVRRPKADPSLRVRLGNPDLQKIIENTFSIQNFESFDKILNETESVDITNDVIDSIFNTNDSENSNLIKAKMLARISAKWRNFIKNYPEENHIVKQNEAQLETNFHAVIFPKLTDIEKQELLRDAMIRDDFEMTKMFIRDKVPIPKVTKAKLSDDMMDYIQMKENEQGHTQNPSNQENVNQTEDVPKTTPEIENIAQLKEILMTGNLEAFKTQFESKNALELSNMIIPILKNENWNENNEQNLEKVLILSRILQKCNQFNLKEKNSDSTDNVQVLENLNLIRDQFVQLSSKLTPEEKRTLSKDVNQRNDEKSKGILVQQKIIPPPKSPPPKRTLTVEFNIETGNLISVENETGNWVDKIFVDENDNFINRATTQNGAKIYLLGSQGQKEEIGTLQKNAEDGSIKIIPLHKLQPPITSPQSKKPPSPRKQHDENSQDLESEEFFVSKDGKVQGFLSDVTDTTALISPENQDPNKDQTIYQLDRETKTIVPILKFKPHRPNTPRPEKVFSGRTFQEIENHVFANVGDYVWTGEKIQIFDGTQLQDVDENDQNAIILTTLMTFEPQMNEKFPNATPIEKNEFKRQVNALKELLLKRYSKCRLRDNINEKDLDQWFQTFSQKLLKLHSIKIELLPEEFDKLITNQTGKLRKICPKLELPKVETLPVAAPPRPKKTKTSQSSVSEPKKTLGPLQVKKSHYEIGSLSEITKEQNLNILKGKNENISNFVLEWNKNHSDTLRSLREELFDIDEQFVDMKYKQKIIDLMFFMKAKLEEKSQNYQIIIGHWQTHIRDHLNELIKHKNYNDLESVIDNLDTLLQQEKKISSSTPIPPNLPPKPSIFAKPPLIPPKPQPFELPDLGGGAFSMNKEIFTSLIQTEQLKHDASLELHKTHHEGHRNHQELHHLRQDVLKMRKTLKELEAFDREHARKIIQEKDESLLPALEAQKKELEQQIKEHKESEAALQKHLAELEREKDHAVSHKERYKAQLQNYNTQVSNLQKEHERLKQEKEALRIATSLEIQKQKDHEKKLKTQLKHKLSDAQLQFQQAQQLEAVKVNALQAQMLTATQDFERKLATHDQQASEEMKALSDEYERLKAIDNQHKQKVDELQQKLREDESAIEVLNAQHSEGNTALQTQIAEKQAALYQKTSELENAKADQMAAAAQMTELVRKIGEQNEQLQQDAQQIATLQSRLEQMQQTSQKDRTQFTEAQAAARAEHEREMEETLAQFQREQEEKLNEENAKFQALDEEATQIRKAREQEQAQFLEREAELLTSMKEAEDASKVAIESAKAEALEVETLAKEAHDQLVQAHKAELENAEKEKEAFRKEQEALQNKNEAEKAALLEAAGKLKKDAEAEKMKLAAEKEKMMEQAKKLEAEAAEREKELLAQMEKAQKDTAEAAEKTRKEIEEMEASRSALEAKNTEAMTKLQVEREEEIKKLQIEAEELKRNAQQALEYSEKQKRELEEKERKLQEEKEAQDAEIVERQRKFKEEQIQMQNILQQTQHDQESILAEERAKMKKELDELQIKSQAQIAVAAANGAQAKQDAEKATQAAIAEKEKQFKEQLQREQERLQKENDEKQAAFENKLKEESAQLQEALQKQHQLELAQKELANAEELQRLQQETFKKEQNLNEERIQREREFAEAQRQREEQKNAAEAQRLQLLKYHKDEMEKREREREVAEQQRIEREKQDEKEIIARIERESEREAEEIAAQEERERVARETQEEKERIERENEERKIIEHEEEAKSNLGHGENEEEQQEDENIPKVHENYIDDHDDDDINQNPQLTELQKHFQINTQFNSMNNTTIQNQEFTTLTVFPNVNIYTELLKLYDLSFRFMELCREDTVIDRFNLMKNSEYHTKYWNFCKDKLDYLTGLILRNQQSFSQTFPENMKKIAKKIYLYLDYIENHVITDKVHQDTNRDLRRFPCEDKCIAREIIFNEKIKTFEKDEKQWKYQWKTYLKLDLYKRSFPETDSQKSIIEKYRHLFLKKFQETDESRLDSFRGQHQKLRKNHIDFFLEITKNVKNENIQDIKNIESETTGMLQARTGIYYESLTEFQSSTREESAEFQSSLSENLIRTTSARPNSSSLRSRPNSSQSLPSKPKVSSSRPASASSKPSSAGTLSFKPRPGSAPSSRR